MLPEPRAGTVFIFLILLKTIHRRDQHAGLSVRAQTHIHVKEDAGAGRSRQPVNQAARKAHIDLFSVLGVILK